MNIMKWKIIKSEDDGRLYIVLKDKTSFANSFNNHQYLNNKLKNRLFTLHNKKNWREIAQAVLDNIQLPEYVGSFSDLDYRDLVFNFRTVTGQVLSIPLYHSRSANVNTILSEWFNPSFFRTDFPRGLIGNHLADFVTIVLYELFNHASELDSMIQEAMLPPDYIVDNNGAEYHFDIASVDHDRLVLNVTDADGNPCNVDTWSLTSDRNIIINSEGYEIQLNVGYYDYYEDSDIKAILDNPDAEKHIEAYNFKEDKLTLTFPSGTFTLAEEKRVLSVQVAHDEEDSIILTRFLSYVMTKTNTVQEKLVPSWNLEIGEVRGGQGETVQLDSKISDPDGSDHEGVVRYYLIE